MVCGGYISGKWFTEGIAALRTALAAAPDSAALVRALYGLQRMDRHDGLGERDATMALLATIHAPLADAGAGALTARAQEAAEAALVGSVHDALRAGRYDDVSRLVAPLASGPGLLPEVEEPGARRTLALALVALDEASGDLPSAIARLEAVVADLGTELGPEQQQLARDLRATAAMLARRLGGEAQASGRSGMSAGAAHAESSSSGLGLPSDYALEAPYPNPFTGRTAVPFALPEAAHVRVEVYDALGRRVAVLADGVYEGAGTRRSSTGGRSRPGPTSCAR